MSTILKSPDSATPKLGKAKGSRKINIIKSTVEEIQPPDSGQLFIYDAKLPGFGIRVSAGGSKMYIAQGRVRNAVVRYSIGKHGVLTADQARTEAKRVLGLMASGVDPNEEKRHVRNQKKLAVRVKSDDAGSKDVELTYDTITLSQLLELYISKQAKPLRSTTVYLYRGAIRRCFADWADVPVLNITGDMVEQRNASIANRQGPRGEGGAHAHQSMRILRTLYNYARVKFKSADGKSLFPDNPVRILTELKAWTKPKRRQTYISKTDLPAWHKAVMGLQNETARDFLLFVLFTGLRRTEAATLRWSDINFGAKTFSIPAERTKTHQEHKVPLCAYLIEMLTRRHANVGSDFIFPGKDKTKPLAEPKRAVASVVAKSKVKFMIHDLRRTCTTVAESLDMPYYVLKRLGNWSNASDVTGGYIVQDVERMREPMERISVYFQQAFIEPES
ncbi:MAG: tyrosine-type recombinase/integrase [Cyanobacteria bacterium SZAS-4]|nr:tyrosine-type recombinase/integrase [Cyanobacteria bacterium SZAS-4]